MNWRDHIHSDPAILGGKPVIIGSRISVELILGRLSDGWSEDDLLRSFPHVSREQVRAAMARERLAAQGLSVEPLLAGLRTSHSNGAGHTPGGAEGAP